VGDGRIDYKLIGSLNGLVGHRKKGEPMVFSKRAMF
jgi:hypothetical protein